MTVRDEYQIRFQLVVRGQVVVYCFEFMGGTWLIFSSERDLMGDWAITVLEI